MLSKQGFEKKEELKGIKLSRRELEVVDFLANGYSTKQISAKLSLSSRTVESHRLRMLNKFEARNSMELIKILKERLLII
jgi:DNA-binding NarL/FixJ family response regulator